MRMILGAVLLFAGICGCAKSDKADDIALIQERYRGEQVSWMAALLQGFAAFDARDADAAALQLDAAYQQGCRDPLALYRYGVVLAQQGKTEEARALLLDAASDLAAFYPGHRANPELWITLGNMDFRAEDYAMALGRYERALAAAETGAGGRKSDIYYSMGMALRRLARYAEAANWMEKANADDFLVNYYIADVYNELKKYDLAMRRMQRAADLKPEESRASGTLGHFYYALSEREEQAERFDKALEAIRKGVPWYERAVRTGGDMYAEYLEAAKSRIHDLERIKEAAKSGQIRRAEAEKDESPPQ
ncbi:MAG: tetratricopeptide repeat protein [Spirochaetota bacterium]|nr:tetratricopeptide repeat protein [Spirochaetota bacterium]